MEQIIKFFQSVNVDSELLTAGTSIALVAITSRLHILRYLRRLALPTGVVFLIYRLLSASDTESRESLLSMIIKLAGKDKRLQRALGDILGLLLVSKTIQLTGKLFSYDLSSLVKVIKDEGYAAICWLPPIRNELDKEMKNLQVTLRAEIKSKAYAMGEVLARLPASGMDPKELLAYMAKLSTEDDKIWQCGKVSGSVYHGKEEHQSILNRAFSMYSLCNPLHPEVWPSAMKFDSEVISMTASMVNGGLSTVCGCTTSGGTESIILAIKAHRNYYRDYCGITQPEVISCTSAHAAVDKGCDLMGIRHIKVAMNPENFEVDLAALERAVGPNTILIYASAPGYPQGVIDPIEKMSVLALKYNVGLHVDCCLGGFVLPFAKKLGYKIPNFDFGVPGVTSMSVDTHKYGYALKGSSVVLYRNKELRQAQYFSFPDWTGGIYTTPTIAGSRSGGLIAATWASMVLMGQDGYESCVRSIMETTKTIAAGVMAIKGLKILGATEAMIVCFTGSAEEDVNIYTVGDEMTARGWSLNTLQSPASMHLCVTVCHVGREQGFLNDLKESVEATQRRVKEAKESGGKIKLEGKAAVYGMASSLPAGPVNELLKVYNDVILNV